MDAGPKKATLRLPLRLAYRALGATVVGTLACSSTTSTTPDASTDARRDAPVADAADATVYDAVVQDTGPMPPPTDAVAMDAACDLDAGIAPNYCGPSGTVDGAVCPGPVCDLSDCPLDAGCTPFV